MQCLQRFYLFYFTPQNSKYIEELNRQPTRLGMDNCLSYLEINPKGRVIYYQVGGRIHHLVGWLGFFLRSTWVGGGWGWNK